MGKAKKLKPRKKKKSVKQQKQRCENQKLVREILEKL